MDVIQTGDLEASAWCPGMWAPRGARVGDGPGKQNLLENSSSDFVKPIVKGLLKINPLYPALNFEAA